MKNFSEMTMCHASQKRLDSPYASEEVLSRKLDLWYDEE